MLRYILGAILFLLALRFVSVVTRLLTAGRWPGPRLNEEPRVRPRTERPHETGPQKARRRDRHSEAVDVPFTEIPPDSPP